MFQSRLDDVYSRFWKEEFSKYSDDDDPDYWYCCGYLDALREMVDDDPAISSAYELGQIDGKGDRIAIFQGEI